MITLGSCETVVDTRRKDVGVEVTVVVPTHNRSESLTRLLEALACQSLSSDRFEVIVIDDGSSDDSPSRIKELARRLPFGLLAVRVPSSRGPAAARNIGWRSARSRWIAFTDDDCAPVSNWLSGGLEALVQGQRVVVGRTIPDPELPIGPFSTTVHVESVGWIPTCNVFYSREDLETVGGFDEAFPTPGGEDTDLAYRVADVLGREFVFEPAALVLHDVRPSRFLLAAKDAWKWVGIPRFFKLHPRGRSNLTLRMFWKPAHPLAIAAGAGVLLSSAHVGWMMLVLPWIYFRLRGGRPSGSRRRVLAALPGILALDLLEIVVMVRGSIRDRTLVL